MPDLTEFFVIAGAALTCALLASAVLRLPTAKSASDQAHIEEPIALLFDEGVLHHGTQTALTTFALVPGAHVWDDLRQSLLARFPNFPKSATDFSIDSMTLHSAEKDDTARLKISWRDDLCWVELSDTEVLAKRNHATVERHRTLEVASETSPNPAWETTPDGRMGWCNAAYVALRDQCKKGADDAVFPPSAQEGKLRAKLRITPEQTEWYEVSSHKSANGMIHHATSITHLVTAEDAQRTFVQTLAKTFAQLPIGLAIFDRKGQLSIFNPALVDLSGLQPQHLAGKPTMLSFFDALRENRRMPEPKNYNAWRKDIGAMIAAAADGRYDETWALEDGRTYTVQGRPHPDGATAFLIEDISAEVSLTRNFRTELEQYEALLNNVKDALIVFSSNGIVTYSNQAYQEMWGQNPETAFADVTVQDAVDIWEDKIDVDWSDVTDFIKTLGYRAEKTKTIRKDNVDLLSVKLTHVAPNSTLVRFSKVDAVTDNGEVPAG